MYCQVRKKGKCIDYVHRKFNGDITVRTYCYQEGSKKGTHVECGNHIVIYKNGGNYNLRNKILYDDKYKNLIGCWCDDNLRFQTPVEAQNHRLEKHPEEF